MLFCFAYQFIESQFELRSHSEHSRQCAILERDDLANYHQHYSAVFGVNRRALLDSLNFFSVVGGALIPDIMHDVLEGILPLEVKAMLKVKHVSTITHNLIIVPNNNTGICYGKKAIHSCIP